MHTHEMQRRLLLKEEDVAEVGDSILEVTNTSLAINVKYCPSITILTQTNEPVFEIKFG